MFFEIRTLYVVYAVSCVIGVCVMMLLWQQNRKRTPEIGLWLIYYVLQLIALVLVTLRGVVPDLVSIVLANTLIICGTVALYVGLLRYVEEESPLTHNYVMVAVFAVVYTFLTFVYPSLALRNVTLALGVLYVGVQGAWLMLHRVRPELRQAARATGIVLAGFCVVSIIQIVDNLTMSQSDQLFASGLQGALIILGYQTLFIALTFALFLLVSRRLLVALESELAERHQTETTLKKSEEQVRLLLNSTAEAIYGIDLEGNCTFANPSCLAMLGYTGMEQLLGKDMHRLIHHSYPDGRAMPVEDCKIYQAFREGKRVHVDDEVLWKADGTGFPTEYWSYPQQADGEIKGAVVAFIDISKRKEAQDELSRSEEKFSKAFQTSPYAIAITRLQDGAFIEVNDAFVAVTGYSREDLARESSIALQLWVDQKDRQEMVSVMRAGAGLVGREFLFRKKNGDVLTGLFSAQLIGLPEGLCILSSIEDITARKRAEETIAHLANHDYLTDLPSLRLAKDRLSIALSLARRNKSMTAVMFIDLDGFKSVNDNLGHDAGDYVLKQVASRMLSCVRESDTVARVGGDEFLLVVTELHVPEDAARIAEKIISVVSQPIVYEENQARVGASIGIALYPDQGDDMDRLIRQADTAMYRVKNAGKNGFTFARPDEESL